MIIQLTKAEIRGGSEGRMTTAFCEVNRNSLGKFWAIVLILVQMHFASLGWAETRKRVAQTKVTTKRPVTVEDAITMTQTGDRNYLDSFATRGNVGIFSPDGSKFAFVTQKGNMKNNTVEFTLLVFRTAKAFESPTPDIVAKLATSSNREAISHVTWLADNDTLVFLGENPKEIPQIYKVRCANKRLQRLTNHPTEILDFAIGAKGDKFVYVARTKPLPIMSEEMRERGFAVTTQEWTELYTNQPPAENTLSEIFVKTSDMGAAKKVGKPIQNVGHDAGGAIMISPTGRYALETIYVINPPAAWANYEDNDLQENVKACAANPTGCLVRQYLLISLDSGNVEPLIQAPTREFELATWIPGEDTIAVVDAFLPLGGPDSVELKKRQAHIFAAEIKLPSREIVEILEEEEPFQAESLQWDGRANQLVILPDRFRGGPTFALRRESGTWIRLDISSDDDWTGTPLLVTLDEDMNSPPKLAATDLRTHQKATLLDLNPQFRDLDFGRVEVVHWKTMDGDEASGELYYPPDYVAGRKYPLVIQTHAFCPKCFWIDGPWGTAYAAQPLASHGFVVLQMYQGKVEEIMKRIDTADEAPHSIDLYEAAIDSLDEAGIIDRNRVGLTGFSRTVYHVLFALTHSRYRFAAATTADGIDFGYGDCVFYAHTQPTCERKNGGQPYGDSVENWRKMAINFNLDKITAPLLLQSILAPLSEWEIYSGLRWLHKPTELLNFYPEGIHTLVKPGQRNTSQQTTVDWFCFWIEGEEDPDPAKAEQYARWRELQRENEANRGPAD
jgi:dipeptidyl aminopeptidase/acylaminoacyl peptidase